MNGTASLPSSLETLPVFREKAIVRELVVISGKGGTGKTSLTAAFAVLAGGCVIADCDVDAADLHLLLRPRVLERHTFVGGRIAIVRQEACIGCGACLSACRFDAVKIVPAADGSQACAVDPHACEGCGVCVHVCPAQAIDFPERSCGSWMVSETRCGAMVHACLIPGAENSGKLVTAVRRKAREIAEMQGGGLVLADGPPGIGCPVIASLTGASTVLVVTEPTPAGEHDMERVLALANHFHVPAYICINKWDLHPALADRIEEKGRAAGARIAGRIAYDTAVTRAMMAGQTVVDGTSPAAADIRRIWEIINARS